MPVIKLNPEEIPFSPAIQRLCLRTGGSFPRGCPNYNKKQGCPPQPLIDEIFDFSKPVYLIYTNFNVRKVAERMRQRHPEWTEKALYNCRYWQQGARKLHYQEVEKLLNENPGLKMEWPENHGVNVHKLMLKKAHIQLEWPPRNLTRIVSLSGYPNT